MDLILGLILLTPILMAIFGKLLFPHHVTLREWGAHVGVSVVLIGLVWGGFNLARYSDAWDVEVWNGQITSMDAQRRSCPSGWRSSTDSFCTEYRTRQVYAGESCTTVGETRTCTPQYDTEYRYEYDWERRYFILTNIGNYEIDRVDRQGVNTPRVFSAKRVGDAVSKNSGYYNWVNAAADSLFREDPDLTGMSLTYPNAVYDYFEVDRYMWVGVDAPTNAIAFNRSLSQVLGVAGPKYQMNAIVVVADASLGADFPYAARKQLRGFKKNDAAIFVMVDPATMEIRTSYVLSWSKENLFNIKLAADLNTLRGSKLEPAMVSSALATAAPNYVRRSMTEFEYLKDQIPVPFWVYLLAALMSIGGSIGITAWFVTNDVTENATRTRTHGHIRPSSMRRY